MVCTTGQNPGTCADFEVRHGFPQCGSYRELGQRFRFDTFYVVYNEAETVAQIYYGSSTSCTYLRREDQAGCLALANTNAEEVYFQTRLLSCNERTNLQHVCLQDRTVLSIEIQRVVLQE